MELHVCDDLFVEMQLLHLTISVLKHRFWYTSQVYCGMLGIGIGQMLAWAALLFFYAPVTIVRGH